MKIFKLFYYIFTAFVALIALLLVFSAIPIPGNYKVLSVLSGSMQPQISTGSIVVIKPANDYKVGDIITFGEVGKKKTPVTHRIYEVKQQEGAVVYVTKGDANNAPDQKLIAKEEIVGKVLAAMPYMGYVINFSKKPIGFALLIILPALIIISDEIKNIYREAVKIREKKKSGVEKSIKEIK